MTQMIQKRISVLVIEEGGLWTAQCLEFDIAAQGQTREDAVDSFQQTFLGQIIIDLEDEKEPFEDFSQAPAEYWYLWEEAEKSTKREPFELPEGVPSAYIISELQERVVCA